MNECSIRLSAETQTHLEDWLNYLAHKGLLIEWEPISICREANGTSFYCNGHLTQMTGATEVLQHGYPLHEEKIHGW